ncbi:MAG: malonyl-ACP O-methyltransferase BioC [Hahellaceae bacterium]|nr:malonyl-ACP O-methyltransferase BioC [Hahellaceae bacterium]
MKWLGNLVLVNGWSMPTAVWESFCSTVQVAGGIEVISLDDDSCWSEICRHISSLTTDNTLLIGWSLGGMLAVDAVATFGARPAALVTLQMNPRFTTSQDWSNAMPAEVYQDFLSETQSDTTAALKRFDFLATQPGQSELNTNDVSLRQEASAFRHDLKALKRYRQNGAFDSTHLSQSLALLKDADVRTSLEALQLPRLHIFGGRDSLVPVAVADKMKLLSPVAKVVVLDEMAHSPWGAFCENVQGVINDWLINGGVSDVLPASSATSDIPVIDKTLVAGSFSRAAASYDQAAHLQRAIADYLYELLASHRSESGAERGKTLDLGSGTGYSLPALAQLSEPCGLYAADLAEGMLQYSRIHHSLPDVSFLVADAEALPFTEGCMDLVFSSLAIQWCHSPEALFKELFRVLRPGGICAVSTLAEGTLFEMEQAWRAADQYQHVNRFLPEAHVRDAAVSAGFDLCRVQHQRETLQYASVRELTRELKMLGAHNLNPDRPRQVTSRARLLAFSQAYEKYRNEGQLPATYEVVYLLLQKPLTA